VAPNKAWHNDHPMPPKATREQWIEWHTAHATACGCRAIPESIRQDVEKRLKSARKKA
jgi:hypothetical protein